MHSIVHIIIPCAPADLCRMWQAIGWLCCAFWHCLGIVWAGFQAGKGASIVLCAGRLCQLAANA